MALPASGPGISLKAGLTMSSGAAISTGRWPVQIISNLHRVCWQGRLLMEHGTGLGSSLPVDWTPPPARYVWASPQSSSQHNSRFPSKLKRMIEATGVCALILDRTSITFYILHIKNQAPSFSSSQRGGLCEEMDIRGENSGAGRGSS